MLLILTFGLPVFADTGTTVDITRSIYSGRTMGMGGAHAALSDDGEGMFTNPSGLSNIEFPQLMGLSRKLMLDETTYTLGSWAVPTQWGTFGLGYAGAQTGGSLPTMRDPGTGRISVNPSLEALSYENNVILFSYAKQIPWQNLSLGGNIKFINQSINGSGQFNHASATSIDLAASYRPFEFLALGANLQNFLGGSLSWNTASEKLGGYYKLGGALNLYGSSSREAIFLYDQKVVAVLDMDIPRDVLSGSTLFHAGLEWTPIKMLSVRAGINQENGGTGFTFGAGLRNNAFRFDYAYAPRPGIAGDAPHYFSLAYVGDRVVTRDRKLKKKISGIRFITPSDRSITSLDSVAVKVEAKGKLVYDQKTTWTVPFIEATHEVKETYELVDLTDVRRNGYPLSKTGLAETAAYLTNGRNVIKIDGYIPPENSYASEEVKILKIIPFADVKMDYWALEPIALNSVLGLIKGYPDNTFRPEKGITRAELTALLVRTSSTDPIKWERAQTEQKFKDIKLKDWYAPYINYGVGLGLVTGYPDNTFKPATVLNRAEGITILARFARLKESDRSAFKDLKDGFWANKYIYPAKEAGLLKYLSGHDFEPNKPFTRAEAAEVLFRTAPILRQVDDFWNTGMISEAGQLFKPSTGEARSKPKVIETPTKIFTDEATTKPATSESRLNTSPRPF